MFLENICFQLVSALKFGVSLDGASHVVISRRAGELQHFGAGPPPEATNLMASGWEGNGGQRGKPKGQTPAGRQTQHLILAHSSARFGQGFGDQRWFE